MQENLQEMISNLNDGTTPKVAKKKIDPVTAVETVTETKVEEVKDNSPEIALANFYDWFEANAGSIQNITRIKSEVSQVNSKDSMIFKIKKKNNEDSKELISFYNPATRPIVNLPPVYMKVFKNDTFEVLHSYNDEIFIKSYGVKNGLILIFCANVDGKVVPIDKIKVKKDAKSIKLTVGAGVANGIREKLQQEVDAETVQLLYKQAVKSISEFTNKEKALDWFLKKQVEVVDINHSMKIDNVLIHII